MTHRHAVCRVGDMSIRVEPHDVAGMVAGAWAYVMTVGTDGAHVVALHPTVGDGGRLHLAVGTGRAARNVAAGSMVTLVFPPRDEWPHAGYSLVVDATAHPVTDGVIALEFTGAVWHRPAP